MKERKETDRGTHGKQESLTPGQGHWAETKEASAYRGQEFIMIVSSGGSYFPLEFCPKCLNETLRSELYLCFKTQYAARKEHIEAFILLFAAGAHNCAMNCFLFLSASKTG